MQTERWDVTRPGFTEIEKIKPPMVFTARDVDRLLDALDVVLGEDAARAG